MASPIMVGRVTVDPTHANLARTLLSVENVLTSGAAEGTTDDSDDDGTYARSLQEAFIQDALLRMEDHWFAKSLSGDNRSPHIAIVDAVAMEYLTPLIDLAESSKPQAESFESRRNSYHSDDEAPADEISEVYHEAARAAAEYQQARLSFPANAGPSSYRPGPTVTMHFHETEFFPSDTVKKMASSSSATDLGELDIGHVNDVDFVGYLKGLSYTNEGGINKGELEVPSPYALNCCYVTLLTLKMVFEPFSAWSAEIL
ncbi:hypothetical protein H0H92_006130 [Tricholoma furcatifolium]|nr:hypothetical protein H0H92_006130 [Tricholoma furcatifolium]